MVWEVFTKNQTQKRLLFVSIKFIKQEKKIQNVTLLLLWFGLRGNNCSNTY